MLNQTLNNEYISRINRVLDYIETNIDKELTLDKLSDIANFSKYHFHRIFRTIVGETLNNFIQRIRLEKAAVQLIENQSKSITEIAFDCGFTSSSTFARCFKDHFKISASQWRENMNAENSKNCKINSNNYKSYSKFGKDFENEQYYFCSVFNTDLQKNIWSIAMKNSNLKTQVEVKELADMNVAYIRHIGPYQGNEKLFENLFGKLFNWAGARNLIRFPETQTLTIYHDNPEITDDDKLRISVCITVPPDTKVDGEIGKMLVPGGKYAVARFEINADQYGEAWDMVYGGWFPTSGYVPDDRPCFELYHNNPNEHPERKHIIDICAPVKPI